MARSTGSGFVDFIPPLHECLDLYDRTKPSTEQPKNDAADRTKAIPKGFIDAMTVRREVFVDEQHVPLENELDDDDSKSYHWVAYASEAYKGSLTPIGTIRLVPPPYSHSPHSASAGAQPKTAGVLNGDARRDSTFAHDGKEAYIKLGRMAVIPRYRKQGISKLLINSALDYAAEFPHRMMPYLESTAIEAVKVAGFGAAIEWKGLVLLHAQVGVQKLYRKYGFETDESMGVWDEEGIDHVGMWRRLELRPTRKPSLSKTASSPEVSP
ncbi:hypothetical protein LTR08_008909 [Meristemomyces frigidus]|nr:hypothetical protein LTR08_008909 [Meristemomyces frigidus]